MNQKSTLTKKVDNKQIDLDNTRKTFSNNTDETLRSKISTMNMEFCRRRRLWKYSTTNFVGNYLLNISKRNSKFISWFFLRLGHSNIEQTVILSAMNKDLFETHFVLSFIKIWIVSDLKILFFFWFTPFNFCTFCW